VKTGIGKNAAQAVTYVSKKLFIYWSMKSPRVDRKRCMSRQTLNQKKKCLQVLQPLYLSPKNEVLTILFIFHSNVNQSKSGKKCCNKNVVASLHIFVIWLKVIILHFEATCCWPGTCRIRWFLHDQVVQFPFGGC